MKPNTKRALKLAGIGAVFLTASRLYAPLADAAYKADAYTQFGVSVIPAYAFCGFGCVVFIWAALAAVEVV